MSDNWFDELDPVEKALMFFNWIEDFNDESKLLENQGYLIGSFINPEMVQKLLGGGRKFEATDDEFDEFSNKLLEKNRQEDKGKETGRRRRKRKIKE